MRNVLHTLKYLITWSPAGDSIWEGLEGTAVLKEVCHRDRLGDEKPLAISSSPLSAGLVDEEVNSQLPALATACAFHDVSVIIDAKRLES